MSDIQGPSSPPHAKKLNLDDLLPEKQPVETSVGVLFVRSTKVSDVEAVGADDERELGRVVLQRLCSRAQGKRDNTALTDGDVEALTDLDLRMLTSAIAEKNGWHGLPPEADLAGLGMVAKVGLNADCAGIAKINADLNASLKAKYQFLTDGVLGKLQAQMADLSKLGVLSGSLIDAQKWAKVDLSKISALTDGIKVAPSAFVIPPPVETPRLYIPRPEQTALGRAALANAEYSKQSSEKIDALVQVVAGLNQTVISEILPAWAKKFSEDQAAGKQSFEHAARGLRWTQLAVYLSVLVTALATGWQVWVAYSIDDGNAAQQQRVEAALREQLAAQRTLIDQQAREGAMLRESLQALKPPPTVQALKARPVPRP